MGTKLRAAVGVAALVTAGCTDDLTKVRFEGDIEGQADDQGSGSSAFAPVASAHAEAFIVGDGGEMTKIGEGDADDTGFYTAHVDFEYDVALGVPDIYVEVTWEETAFGAGSFESAVVASATLEHEGSITVGPTSAHSRVQADVYAEARAESSWDASSTASGLRSQVSVAAANAITTGSSYATDVAAYAGGALAGVQARGEMWADASVGVDGTTVEATLDAEAETWANTDLALAAAYGNAVATSAALVAYEDAVLAAAVSAGMTAQQFAQGTQAQATVAAKLTTGLSASAAAEARIRAEELRADAIHEANVAALTALGVSATALDSAKATLDASLSASAGVQGSITTAWAAYNADVQAELQTAVDQISAVAGVALNTALGAGAGTVGEAKATLTTSIAAATDVSGTVSAYGTFFTAVDTVITAAVGTTLSAGEVQATVDIAINIGLNG